MNQYKSFSKTLGMLLCVLAVAAYIGLLVVSSDVRGYKKLMDNYCTAVQRGDSAKFSELLADSQGTSIDTVLADISGESGATFGKESFKSLVLRYKIDEAEKLGEGVYRLSLDFTLSTKEKTYRAERVLTVQKNNGHWEAAG